MDSGFRSIWFASAFKGATGVGQVLTPIQNHLENHLQWLWVIQSMSQFPLLHFQGLALTGWQRCGTFRNLFTLISMALNHNVHLNTGTQKLPWQIHGMFTVLYMRTPGHIVYPGQPDGGAPEYIG